MSPAVVSVVRAWLPVVVVILFVVVNIGFEVVELLGEISNSFDKITGGTGELLLFRR